MKGKVYYRSDMRPPEVIFKEGFTPKLDNIRYDWWREAIKSRAYTNDYGVNNQAVDADPAVCVCMTTKLESAPIFPLNTEDSYIYAIALPEPTSIEYCGYGTGAVRLDKTLDTPTNVLDIVVDLHSFQTAQTRNICRFFDHSVENQGVFSGWPLYAYEAIAFTVPPISVICAIKCSRDIPSVSIKAECEISDTPKLSEDKKFTLEGEIIKNANFCRAHLLSVGLGSQSRTVLIDYEEVKERVLIELALAKGKMEQSTPNIYYGLGGKAF